MTLPSASQVLELQDGALADRSVAEQMSIEGPDRAAAVAFPIIQDAVLAEHEANSRLWYLEDQARSRSGEDSHIARVKRAIDAWNQRRSDLIERIDEDALGAFPSEPDEGADVPQHSETFGMIVDRLSILSLKIHHTNLYMDEAARRGDSDLAAECGARVTILRQQRGDLAVCLDNLVAECSAGRRYFRVYRQFKAYNDPRLNPVLAPPKKFS